MQGRLQGLAQWCKPSNGYNQGTRGAIYNGVCPEALESDFEFAMSEGRAVYDYRKKVHDHEMLIARMHREYGAIKKQISSMEAELISDQVSPRRRRALLNEIRAAEMERELLRYDIYEADFALNEMHRELNHMKADVIFN
jgi:predicted  nucleic acid-binding Zn-ribbon protein